MTITVVDKRKVPNHIYCGRGSALGNPFIMIYEADRIKVCDDYEVWFYSRVDEPYFLDRHEGTKNTVTCSPQELMLLELFSLACKKDINLGCFCAPKRCHCDTIKTFLDNKLEELEK